MQLNPISAIGNAIRQVGTTISTHISKLNSHQNTPNSNEIILDNIATDAEYGQYNYSQKSKISELKEDLKKADQSANEDHLRNNIFQKEFETASSNIKTCLLILNEIEKIKSKDNIDESGLKRKNVEFLIGEVNDNILKLNIGEPVDFSNSRKMLTVFIAIGVALWTYLSDSQKAESDNIINKSIPFFLNLLPLLVQAAEYIIVQNYKFKTKHLQFVLNSYNDILPELNEIKENLYKEEINNALLTIQKSSEIIMANQLEHQANEHGIENTILNAIEKLSESSNPVSETEIVKDKIMAVLHNHMPLKHQVFKILFQQGENIGIIYKAFEACVQKGRSTFSTTGIQAKRSNTLRVIA